MSDGPAFDFSDAPSAAPIQAPTNSGPTFDFSDAPVAAAPATPSVGSPAVYTLLGEAGTNPQGQMAVASTIINRMTKASAANPDAIVTDPSNGYEAWQNEKNRARTRAQFPPGSPAYVAAQQTLDQLTSGQTKPLPYVSFYAPALQASLGRSKPSWDDGSGVNIGGNVFFSGTSGTPSGSGGAMSDADAEAAYNAAHSGVKGVPSDASATPQIASNIVYDPGANVTRGPDGRVVAIGNAVNDGVAKRGPDGSWVIGINSTSNPDAIDAWLKAHPNDPSLQPPPAPIANTPLARGVLGVQQGISDVANTGNLIGNAFGDAGSKQALSSNIVQRLQNEQQFGNSDAFGLGRFVGQAIPTIPIMAATEGLGGAAIRGAEGFAPGVAGGAVDLASNPFISGAVQGGEAGVIGHGGSNNSLGADIAGGAATGGILAPAGVVAGKFGQFLGRAAQPLTAGGRGEIANKFISDLAAGGPTTLNDTEYVPGSTPTLPQASGNSALISAERALRDANPQAYGARESDNDTARLAHLQNTIGSPATIEQAIADRATTTEPLRTQAMSNAQPADISPAVSAIDAVRGSPAGQIDTVDQTLNSVRRKLVQPPLEMNPQELADFNRQVSASAGASPSPVLDQATMSEAKANTGSIYNDVLSRNSAVVDPETLTGLATVGSQARELGLMPNQIGAIDGVIANITDLAQRNGGMIPGDAFKTLTEQNSTLSRLAQAGGTLGHLAGDIRETLNGALARSTSPEDLALVNRANLQWKNMRTLEGPVLQASRTNPSAPQVTPDSVLGAVTKGFKNFAYTGGSDLGDIASSAVTRQGARGPVLQTDPEQLHAVQMGLSSKIDSLLKNPDELSQVAAHALIPVRENLIDTIDNAAPGYRDYMDTYSSMSDPIRAQQYLQGQRFTDAQGKPTLGAVNNVLTTIAKRRNLPGSNDAKSISPDQIQALTNLHADLLRASAPTGVKSPGSDLFSRLVNNNLFSKAGAPLAAGAAILSHHPFVAPFAYGAKMLYDSKGPLIKNEILNRFLDPQLGSQAFVPKPQNALLNSSLVKFLGRTIPASAYPVQRAAGNYFQGQYDDNH